MCQWLYEYDVTHGSGRYELEDEMSALVCACIHIHVFTHVGTYMYIVYVGMGWLWLVGSIKL